MIIENVKKLSVENNNKQSIEDINNQLKALNGVVYIYEAVNKLKKQFFDLMSDYSKENFNKLIEDFDKEFKEQRCSDEKTNNWISSKDTMGNFHYNKIMSCIISDIMCKQYKLDNAYQYLDQVSPKSI